MHRLACTQLKSVCAPRSTEGDSTARTESGAPPAVWPAEHLRVDPKTCSTGSDRKGCRYGTASDRWRESRHEPGVGERQSRARHRAPRRAGPHRPGEDHRARWLHSAPGHLWPQRCEEAQQARGRPLCQGRRAARPSRRRAAPRLGRRFRGRPGDHGRHHGRGPAGRRHRRQPWQGFRRRHEAPQLQGPGRQPR